MSDLMFPLEPSLTHRRPSARYNQTLERLMDESNVQRKSSLSGTDTAWALKLKTCMDTVARELRIDVLGAKPVQCFGAPDPRDMLFEVDTSRGPLEVLRTRSGEHQFHWLNGTVHMA